MTTATGSAATRSPRELLRELVGPAGRRDPYPVYAALRAHGELLTIKPGLMLALGYAECDRALRDTRFRVQDATSSDRVLPNWRDHSSLRGYVDSMLYRNAPDHTRLRRMVSGAFTPRRVAELRSGITQMAQRLLDGMADAAADGSPVDFIAAFASRLPIAVISALLGVAEQDQAWFRRIAADVTIALEGITTEARLQCADAAMDELAGYFLALAQRRRTRPADDVLDLLARANGSGSISRDELVGNLMLMLTAGFETTTFLLGHALDLALGHPALATRLRKEPGFSTRYVEEVLRFETPVQATSRWAAEDVDLLGTVVPSGTKVVCVLGAGNRDPRRYARVDVFDPDRPDPQPLSFGAGGHFCLGAPLSRLEAQIALPALLQRFPHVAAAGPVRRRDTWVGRGLDHFPVTLG